MPSPVYIVELKSVLVGCLVREDAGGVRRMGTQKGMCN